MPYLRIFEDEEGVRQIRLASEKFLIGRSVNDNDYVINDRVVSRIHAMIYKINQKFYIKDMNSTAGTMLNGDKVTDACLKPGDNLQIGSVVIEFREHPEIDKALADADAGIQELANNFADLPSSMGLNCRILYIKPERVFATGDTLQIGSGGGIKITKPFAGILEDVILELELVWPTGARKIFLGEIIVQHGSRLCVKLHKVELDEYTQIQTSVKHSNWTQCHAPVITPR